MKKGGDGMEVKRITIRVPRVLHEQLHKAADESDISLNTLAVRALEAYVEGGPTDRERFPVRELSALLAPAAEAAELTEEELNRHIREVRRRIWQERYENAVQIRMDEQKPQ
jgi:predicted transcriptional regulator